MDPAIGAVVAAAADAEEPPCQSTSRAPASPEGCPAGVTRAPSLAVWAERWSEQRTIADARGPRRTAFMPGFLPRFFFECYGKSKLTKSRPRACKRRAPVRHSSEAKVRSGIVVRVRDSPA